MQVTTEHIESLFRQQKLQRKQVAAAASEGNFNTAFAQHMTLGGTGAGTQVASSAPGMQSSLVNQLLLGDTGNNTAEEQGPDKVLDQASGALDMWESYVNILQESGADEGSLRNAYALLEGTEAQVSTLKYGSQDLLEQDSKLASLVNELEVLTTTEKFKFNRGDYITE